ncbi:hypothetical protein [[Clostridium] colinum]|uniref:hypothetical protein n=1 Tax=[Clostridium] colinum TaxID=36835 RepID=UPI002024175F|nr:hypothetical protein [[Clostridium] colinum]
MPEKANKKVMNMLKLKIPNKNSPFSFLSKNICPKPGIKLHIKVAKGLIFCFCSSFCSIQVLQSYSSFIFKIFLDSTRLLHILQIL